jgi:alpha-beta hydrolase superfamily lysophospholipase
MQLMRLLRWGAGIILFGAVALPASVIAFGVIESRPVRAVIGPPPADLHAEQVSISSASGATLSGWFIAGRPGGGAMVLMHGVRSNRLSMVERARLLNAEGFSVLLFDFQAHGESTGERITFGYLEGMDADAAVAFMRARVPGERVGALGASLGGAAALLAPEPLPVDALVVESVYPDIEAAVGDRMRATLGRYLGPVVAPPLVWLFMRLLPPVLGIDPATLRPIDRIAQARTPILVASGREDRLTTIAEATALFDHAPSPKLFWGVPGARHVDLQAFDPAEYRRRVLSFLMQALQTPH